MDDRALIHRIQKGQKQYLNTIAEKYYDDIYRFCCYQTGNCQDSYDLAQETFLRFIRYVEKYRNSNLKGYLLTIARNVCMDYFRKEKRRREQEQTGWEEEVWRKKLEEPGTKEVFTPEGGGIALTVKELTRELPAMQREAIILHYIYGLKLREIAKMTGVSLSTVKSRVHQGMEKLKRLLEKEGFHG